MIPYIDSKPFDFFGIPIHLFGILVAIGVIIGDRVVVAQGRRRGLEPSDVKYLNVRIVIGGFILAHLVSVIFYFPQRILESPWVLLNPFAGLSSFGGFLGAMLAFLYFTKRAEVPRLQYADSVALGLSIGWIFGRAGCFTAHDHPGRFTTFFLGVRYPEGTRHDLGFYEMLFTIALAIFLFLYNRKLRPPGRIIGLAALAYAPVRFMFDFLRATDVHIRNPDVRRLGLTPGQWACIATFALAIYLLRRSMPSHPRPEQSDPRSDAAPPPDRTPPETPSSS